VATKFGHQFHADRASRPGADPGSARTDHWTPTEVVAQLEASLRALRTDCIDIYQSHGGSDAEFATPGLWEALSRQVLAGKIRFLGVSLDPADAARAARVPTVGADVVQVTYNRLNRSAEDSVFPAAVDQRLGVRAREPLATGLLSGKYRPGSWITAAGDWRSSRSAADVGARLPEVEQIAATEVPAGVPLARWALAWCLQHPAVSAVIPGSKPSRSSRATSQPPHSRSCPPHIPSPLHPDRSPSRQGGVAAKG
jgi:aryl-alcohol dehydrogenase-like predicted oxidoreductase